MIQGMEPHAIVSIVSFSTVASVLHLVFEKVLPDPTKLYRGYSAANALSSAIWQLVVLPVTFLLLTNGDVPTSHTQWYAFACQSKAVLVAKDTPCFFFYAVLGVQLKDFLLEPRKLFADPQLLAHHFVVMAAAFYAQFMLGGYCQLALVMMILEVASAAYNLSTYWPHSRVLYNTYLCTMTASTLLGYYMVYWSLINPDVREVTRWMLVISGSVVITIRQKVAIEVYQDGFDVYPSNIVTNVTDKNE